MKSRTCVIVGTKQEHHLLKKRTPKGVLELDEREIRKRSLLLRLLLLQLLEFHLQEDLHQHQSWYINP